MAISRSLQEMEQWERSSSEVMGISPEVDPIIDS